MNIYVGNFAYQTTEDELRMMFEAFGEVESVRVIKDRDTGRSKGFGFVEMNNEEEALQAIKELNETEHSGRTIKVNQARPREDRRGGGGRSNNRNYNFY